MSTVAHREKTGTDSAPIRPRGDKIALLLLSAADGMDYYRKAGLEKFDNCFGIRRGTRTQRNQDDDQCL